MAFLGLGAGNIDLSLSRVELKQGESFSGRVSLKLNEPVSARGVFVELRAEKKEKQGKHTYTKILFSQQKNLDSAQQYSVSPKFYDFEFTLPSNILLKPSIGGGLLDSVTNFVSNLNNNSIKWIVEAKLDVPNAFDVRKTIQIRVNP